MIQIRDRVPGQLMPVGARYWYNAGKPIPSMKGLGSDVLTSEQAAAMIMAESSGSASEAAVTTAAPTTTLVTTSEPKDGKKLILVLALGALGLYLVFGRK